ncbi:hypothetical protein EV363DRAFT_1171014, partial [Boletus edulis]
RAQHQTAITLIKTSLSLSDPVHVITALLYHKVSTIDLTPVLINEDSWKELAPYVHVSSARLRLCRPT